MRPKPILLPITTSFLQEIHVGEGFVSLHHANIFPDKTGNVLAIQNDDGACRLYTNYQKSNFTECVSPAVTPVLLVANDTKRDLFSKLRSRHSPTRCMKFLAHFAPPQINQLFFRGSLSCFRRDNSEG